MTKEEKETIKNGIEELTVIDGMTVAELKIFMKGYELACKKASAIIDTFDGVKID